MRIFIKRVFVLFLCLTFVVSSFSVPRFAQAETSGDTTTGGNITGDSTTGEIHFNVPSSFCYFGETIGIEVNDPDLNTNPDVQETVVVTVSSSALIVTGGSIQALEINLTENSSNSGQFTGNVKISNVTNSTSSPMEIKVEASGTVTAEYSDNGTIKSASAKLGTMLQGAVSLPDNTPATGGSIDVNKIIDNQPPEYIGPFPINGGTYAIPQLSEGKYYIRANQFGNAQIMGSKGLEINVGADGVCKGSDNQVLPTVNFVFQKVQFNGTVTDKTGGALDNSKYDIEIRSTDNKIGHNIQFNWEPYAGAFRVGGLVDGNYLVKAISRINGNADSYEMFFTIEGGAVKAPVPTFNLQLTNPQVTGVVKLYDGAQVPVPHTSVDVFDAGWNYIWSTQTDDNGNFNIGGLETGSYKIRANNQAKPDYTSMDPIDITIDSSHNSDKASVVLYLEKKILKLKWVEPFVIHYSEIRLRLDNTSLLNNDWSKLTATINGNDLSNPIVLSNPRRGQTWGEEGEFFFNVDDSVRSNLNFGKYTVEVQNNGVALPSVKNDLDIIQQLKLIPGVAELSKYQSEATSFSLDVDEVNNKKDYPWNVDEVLTVKVIKEESKITENTVTVTVPSDKVLQLALPAHTGVSEGRRDIEVYRGTQLIARGGFDVGVSTIGKVMANEGSDEAALQGEYLGSYSESQTRAELWLDGKKLSDSINTSVGGDVRFRFDYTFKTGLNYTLKVFINNVEKQLPSGGVFTAIPRLDWINPDFTTNNNKSFTIVESNLEGFGWSSGDEISVRLSGPGAWDYTETNGTNLKVNDNNLIFTVTDGNGQGRNFPLPEGEFYLEVYKEVNEKNVLIGFTNVIVANDVKNVLCGTVLNSDKTNANGGYINTGKKYDGWGERFTVGHDGKFYALRNRLRGNGTYYMTAVPSETSSDAPGNVTFEIKDNDFSKGVTIELIATQVKGTVNAGTSLVKGGSIDVRDPSQDWNIVQSTIINQDGTYKLGGLLSGKKYYLVANGPGEIDYVSSDQMEVTYNGTLLQNVNFDLKLPQITGTAKDGDQSNLMSDKYDINVRSLNHNNDGCETKIRDGRFIIGNLQPGTYAVAIAPSGDSEFARSSETIVSIDENGIASPAALTLEFSQPMLTGSVYDKDNTLVTTDGYVEVWTDQQYNSKYICSIPLYQGTYKVGGLSKGNYKIKAGASEYTQLANTNSVSYFVKVELGNSVINKDLYLIDRSIPRILWVDDAWYGDDRIYVRILNYQNLSVDNFTAEILDANGNELNPRLIIPSDKIKMDFWAYNTSDETNIELFIDGNLKLAAGAYQLKLVYGDTKVANDEDISNTFYVSYPLGVQPKGVYPKATQGMSLKLFVDDYQGGYMANLWNNDDILTVNLTASDGKIYSNLPCTKNTDNSLNTVIPEVLDGGRLSDGWTYIELFKGGKLLATGSLVVGIPVIERVDDANEGSDTVRVFGEYLQVYDNPQITAKIFDDTNQVVWESDNSNFNWDGLEFYSKDSSLPAGQYEFRLFNGSQIIATLPINIAPRLICTPHAIQAIEAGQSTQLVIKTSSIIDLNDSIENYWVQIGGPANWYDIESNDLSFDDNKNIIVAISGTDGEEMLSETGEGWLDLYKVVDNQKIGYCKFTIGLDAISATVKDPLGNVVPNATVRITNLSQPNNQNKPSTEVQTDSEGRFYLSKSDLPRYDESSLKGDYSFLVMAPKGSDYATSMSIRYIDPANNNNIELSLAQPQITGVVRQGTQSVSGGAIEVQKLVNDQWQYLFEFYLNPDGEFSIGGLEEGTYFIRAHEDKDNINYVSSDFAEVHVTGTTISNVTLNLNPVQISGDALDPSGVLLNGNQYHVNVRPLDEQNKEVWGESRQEDGQYRIGALKPGKYAISLRPNRNVLYTQSKETVITIAEDGTADINDLPIMLTQPKLYGRVTANGSPFYEGYVDIFTGTWQRPMYVTTVELDDSFNNSGYFRIGGIPYGTYFVRAALWNNSQYRSDYSQSVMTQITLEPTTTTELQLSLVKNIQPRIRYVDDAYIGDDRISVHIVNLKQINFNMLQAQILDQNDHEIGAPIIGADKFFFDGWYDNDKDEGNLGIRINGNIQLPRGKYKLKLTYNNQVLQNETPEINSFNGFNISNKLNIMPYAVVPEDTFGKVLELGLDMEKSKYPWSANDTVEVIMYTEDGSTITLPETIAVDKTMTVKLPTQGLAYGKYTFEVYVNEELLAKSDFTVSDPKVEGISDITEQQQDIRIYGQNLIIYMDGTTTAKVYDSTGTNLLLTDNDPKFYGDIVVNLYGMTLAPGDYILRLYYKNGTEISPSSGWNFKSVDLLRATPSYMIANQTQGKTVTLNMSDGSNVPWNTGDTLKIHVRPDWYNNEEFVITQVASDTTNKSLTFSFTENKNWIGNCSITINKVDTSGDEIYVGYAHFNLVVKEQLTGKIFDTDGQTSPYSYVYLKKKNNDNWYYSFDADSDGNYGIYGLQPGEYTVYAAPEQGKIYMDSDGFDITIDSNGNCSALTHDFNLKPGRRISGTIILPTGVEAPVNGLRGWIRAWNDYGTPDDSDDISYGNEFWFKSGDNTAQYSIIVPEGNDAYYIQTWCDGPGLVNSGVLYSTKCVTGSALTLVNADLVNVASGNLTGINISLMQGNAISGTISLPFGVAPAGGIDVEISVYDDKNTYDYKDDLNAGIRVTIPENQSSIGYTIIVPPSGNYKMEYKMDQKYQYFGNGFYKTSSVTTYDRDQAVGVDGTSNPTGINLTVIPARFITGFIALPQDYQLPTGGVKGWIEAKSGSGTEVETDDRWFGTFFEIINNTTKSTTYTIAVPIQLNDFIVQLWVDGVGLVNCSTYYSKSGSVFSQSAASVITFTDSNEKTGVNIALEQGKTITGTITLPSAAPAGGRGFKVLAIRDNGTLSKYDDIVADANVKVEEGHTSATYTIHVPAMDGYKVCYVSDDEHTYENYGFYSTQGTVFDFDLGTTVNASNQVSGINLTVSPIMKPICNKAEVIENGTAVQLTFSKELNLDSMAASPAGLTIKVGQDLYEIDGVTANDKANMLTLHIKDYKIFKDYKDIKVTFDDAAGLIVAYDGMKLDSFTMNVTNKSTREYSVITGFASEALLNKNAVINVAASGAAITISDNGVIVASGSGVVVKEISKEGSHAVVITVAGRKQVTNLNFTIDKTAPEVSITSPNDATVLMNDHTGIIPVINFSADSVPASRTITLNGSTLSTTTTNNGLTYTGAAIREAGKYVLTATAKDTAGNVKTVSSTFVIKWDNNSPIITINGVTNGGIYETATGAAISVSLSADESNTDSNQANYSYKSSLKWPNGYIKTGNNTVPDLDGQGTYRLEIVATNPGYTDKTSSKVVEFTIDNTAPVTTVEGVTNDMVYNYAVTPIIGFSDGVASQQILQSNAIVSLTKDNVPVTYHIGDTLAMDGSYVLTVSTKDAINHVSNTVTRNFIIDKTKPVISITGALNGTTYKDQNVTLTFKTNEGSLTVVDGDNKTIALNGSGQYTFAGTANQVVNYKVTAKAVDTAGNITEQQISFSIDRLAVNIIVNGVTEGMLVNSTPEIYFTTFEGTQEKQGTTVTIDNVAFTGGRYTTPGTHTLVASYISGGHTYTKTLNFTIDKTAPVVSVVSVLKNNTGDAGNLIAKAGDTITIKANVTEANGVGNVVLKIGAISIPMSYVDAGGYYEGKYIVESGNFDALAIAVDAKDKAGNYTSQPYGKTLTIDNTKPLVSLVTNPAIADGNNGIYKSPTMKLTLVAGANDTISWNLNGNSGSVAGSKELTTLIQGTNVLVYHAQDTAGNVSDDKVFIFTYDSNRPANVSLDPTESPTTSMEYLKISGSVPGEGSTPGTMVLLKKSGETIAKVSLKTDSTFAFDGIKLAEGLNTFTVTAIDRAGNESAEATTLTRTLDSTAPVLNVEKINDTSYTVTSNENINTLIVKFNGVVVVPEGNVEPQPSGQSKIFHITTPLPVEGANILNVTAFDTTGNMGTGSFTSTYIPPHTAQDDLPLNDNASMDIPGDAFGTSTQILVKTVDVDGITNFKPLGAAISFEFTNDQGVDVHPTTPLLIKNYIGVGLNGVVLMHVNASGVIDSTLTATVINSTDAGYQTTIDNMAENAPYYVSDTGYLIFRTTNFSSYQVAQDNVAPVLTVSTTDFEINKADKTAGGMKIEGSITDNDPNVQITEVLVDGVASNISGINSANLDESYSIPLNLTDGTHEITLKAADSAGNTTTVIKTYQVDITPPSLTATAAVTNTNRNTVDISINTDEMAAISINGVSKGQFNGGAVIAYELTNNSVNTINVIATDTFGNSTSVPAISVTCDLTAPTITITGVNDGDVYGNDVTISVNVTDPHTPNTNITLDGSNFAPGVVSTEGQHTLIVASTDSFGNASTRTVVFTIDKSVPLINVSGVENEGKYNEVKTLTVSANNVDELIITKSTDNQEAVNVNTTVEGTNANASLSLGTSGEQHSYKVVITARKTVNGQVRSASTSINLTVDMKKPVITSTTASQTDNATIDLTGTIDETADIYLGSDKVITSNAAGNFSITGKNLEVGLNTFHIKAVDGVGNETLLTINVTRNEIVNNGGNNNGGNNGGIPGGIPGGAAPSTGTKVDETKPEDSNSSETNSDENKLVTIQVKPELSGGIAKATTTTAELQTAIADSEKDTNGVKTVKIEIQKVEGAKSYTEVLPIKIMKTQGADLNIQVATPLGTITVPGDMFVAKDTYKKSSIGISIEEADKSKLDKDTLKAIGNKPIIEVSAALDGKAITWSNPSAPVTIAIPYTPSAAELKDPDHIVVWYIDSNGKVQTVSNGKYDAKTGTVIFTTTHFSKYAVAYVTKTFKDITKLATKAAIEVVASKGIMKGKTDTKFDPNGKVTKGEFIAYLINTLGLTAEVKANFADVKASNPNYTAIGVAMKFGIISGTSKSKFNPDKLITKEEMAIYTVRAMKLSQKTLKPATRKDLSKFSDSSKISNSAITNIAILVKSGILKITGDQINSKGNLTRAEIAEILYNIYKAE